MEVKRRKATAIPQIALEFIPGTRASIHFVNTYSLSPLTLTPDQSYLRGEKVLTGRNWQNGDSFTFEVRALSPANAPLPQKAECGRSGIGRFESV